MRRRKRRRKRKKKREGSNEESFFITHHSLEISLNLFFFFSSVFGFYVCRGVLASQNFKLAQSADETEKCACTVDTERRREGEKRR